MSSQLPNHRTVEMAHPSAEVGDRTALVAVLAEDRLLHQALASAIRSASCRTISAADLSPSAPELAEAQAFLVVPGPDPRRLGLMLAALRRQSPTLSIVALSPDQQRLVALAAEIGSPIETASTVDEALALIRSASATVAGLVEPLTPRHLEILRGIAAGRTPLQVANDIGITMKTLNNHLGSVYRRLDVENLTQAVLRAHRLGLVRL
jgi:DNA-binding CsgD family transcriptional regulator